MFNTQDEIDRIREALRFLNLESAQACYLSTTKAKINSLSQLFEQILADKDTPARFSFTPLFSSWARKKNTQYYRLKHLLMDLETLADRILKYPAKYTQYAKNEHEQITPGRNGLPSRERIVEQYIIKNLLDEFRGSLKERQYLLELYESLNWFSDQNAIHTLSQSTITKICYLIERVQITLNNFAVIAKESYKEPDKADKLLVTMDAVIRAARQVNCLVMGMQNYRKFYLVNNKATENKIIAYPSVSL